MKNHKGSPVKNRFPKGTSGNPNGRPAGRKGQENISQILERIFSETITIRENGESIRVTILEALIKIISQEVMLGNKNAYNLWQKYLNDNQFGTMLEIHIYDPDRSLEGV